MPADLKLCPDVEVVVAIAGNNKGSGKWSTCINDDERFTSFTWSAHKGQVAGSRPAGELLPPLFVTTSNRAVPVVWPGNQASKMAGTDAFWTAHVMFRGPPLKSSKTTGEPLPVIMMKSHF
jgi:hypothetical protein